VHGVQLLEAVSAQAFLAHGAGAVAWAVAQNKADHLLEALLPRIQAVFAADTAICARPVLIADIKTKLMTERPGLSVDNARRLAVKLTDNIMSKAFPGYKAALDAHLESVAAHQATIRAEKLRARTARMVVGASASGLSSSEPGVCNDTRHSTAELATEPTSYKLCASCHSFAPLRPHCATSLRLTHALHLQHVERVPPLAVRQELKPQAAPTPRTAPPSATAPTAKPMI
jgi:hypothetical protein